MPIRELSPELWVHIFSFCVEKGDQGVFTPQPVLVNALRVSSAFFLAAAPHLYRSPIVYDIASFFLGAGNPIPVKPKQKNSSFSVSSTLQDIDHLKAGNTKLPALRHVRKLNIVPYPKTCRNHDKDDWPKDESGSERKKRVGNVHTEIYQEVLEQERYLDQAQRILYSIPSDLVITPNLRCLTLGTCLFADCMAAETILDSFTHSVNSLRPLLWKLCRPKHWCEYNLDSRSEVRAMDIEDDILPKQIIIHNEPTERKGFPVYWGTKNRIMIRLFTDANPEPDPRERSKSVNENENEDEVVRGILAGEETSASRNSNPQQPSSIARNTTTTVYPDQWQDENEDSGYDENPPFSPGGTADPFFSESFWDEPDGLKKHDAVEMIIRSIKGPYPSWLTLKTPNKSKIDKSTLIEIYGLEKILRGWHRGDEENLINFDNIFDDSDSEASSTDEDSEMGSNNSWSTVESENHTEKRQKRALEKIEELVNEEMTNGFNHQGWSKKSTPTVKLHLAKEMPKCEACGQGEEDKWVWNPIPEKYRKVEEKKE